jgi:transcriptional regulator with XRE-family HTH domain
MRGVVDVDPAYRRKRRPPLVDFYHCVEFFTIVAELAERLREARSARGLSLEAASGAAKISTAYLHKLEAGRVRTPSPHVLRRLGQVLEVPYPALMMAAGYLDSKEMQMTPSIPPRTPTNAEIVRLLEQLRAELSELRRGQEELAKRLEQAR